MSTNSKDLETEIDRILYGDSADPELPTQDAKKLATYVRNKQIEELERLTFYYKNSSQYGIIYERIQQLKKRL